ncbi:flagellar protein FlhE [Cupriavidus plantarum]|nr:Flagellar protein FlhE [Cupriavidus plantarum]SMR86722.1 flagellar protein FlhE [Cupriavidus plantarum]
MRTPKLALLCIVTMASGAAAAAPSDHITRATLELGSRHAWNASVVGPTITGRGQRTLSAPIQPGAMMPQSEGVITSVRWRYSFARIPPVDLQAYLCNAQRCVMLSSPEGKTDAFSGDDAAKGFVFAFRVPGQGVLPVLQGRSNEVTVSYR